MNSYRYPVVLTIAGSDSGGGAGIQADLKTLGALGCFGTTAITAVTVQNTLGVSAIHPIPVQIVKAQIRAVMDDLKPLAIKIGMVGSIDIARAIAGVLRDYPDVPVVFDPVMVASSGDHLIEGAGLELLNNRLSELSVLSCLLTPNLQEAEKLSGIKINTVDDMKTAAKLLVKSACRAVLIKGGHLSGPLLTDVFLDENGIEKVFESIAIDTKNTHGTGCTLSAAIAAHLALGYDLINAVQKSIDYVHHAITFGKDVITGEGHGPLNHFFDPQKLVKYRI